MVFQLSRMSVRPECSPYSRAHGYRILGIEVQHCLRIVGIHRIFQPMNKRDCV